MLDFARKTPPRADSPAPAGQKAAPTAGLALCGSDPFGEFIGFGLVIDPGIVGRPDNRDPRRVGGGDADAMADAAAVEFAGELSCAAGENTSLSRCRGGSTKFFPDISPRRGDGGAASIASSNGEDSIAALLSDGKAESGLCHCKASSRPDTGDTGRQRSLT